MNKEYFSSINDVSTRLDIPAHTLRYWEKQFPTVIRPTTGNGGRRYYRPETVGALEIIKDLLYNRGMTIMGVKKIIKDGNLENVSSPLAEGWAKPEVSLSNPQSLSTSRDSRALPLSRGEPTHKSEIDDAIKLLEAARALLA